MMTLPESPDLAAANAASCSVCGKRWVMTGVMSSPALTRTADWYHDMPPYVALKPSFYRKRYFMMARERNRYRYMPHIFSGPSADEGIDYGPDVTFDYEKLTSTNGDGDMPKR